MVYGVIVNELNSFYLSLKVTHYTNINIDNFSFPKKRILDVLLKSDNCLTIYVTV